MAQPSEAEERPATGISIIRDEAGRPPTHRAEPATGSSVVSLFSTDDYPKEAWQNGEQGIVDVTLSVDVDGKVADCVVNHSSGSAALDVQTCRILWTRARFTPARDAQGRAIQDTYRQRIRWELPEGDPAELKEQYARHIVTVDVNKSLVDCRYEASPDWQKGGDHCPEVLEQMRKVVSTAPDWVEFAGNELVLEMQHRVGDPQGELEIGERQGERALSLSRLYLSVDALGKVKSCSKDSWGVGRASSGGFTCDFAQRWNFEEIPAEETNKNDRQLTVVTAIYLRKPAASPAQVQAR